MKKWGFGILAVICLIWSVSAGAFGGGKIVNGSNVMLVYSLKADGVIIVSDERREGMELVVGQGAYPADFEKQLMGMKKGETRVIQLTPQQAFGIYDRALLRQIPLSAIPQGVNLREGQLIGGKNGQRLMRIVKILPDAVVVDQNHPLAGKNLQYKVEVQKLK